MRNIWYVICLASLLNLCAWCAAASAPEAADLKYVQADELMIIGKGFDSGAEKYGRLPAKRLFRKSLLDLGRQSAGIAVRFATDSKRIAVKWTLTGDNSMNHMPATGIKGLDLYSLEGDKWYYRGTAIPAGKTTSGFFNYSYSPFVQGYTGKTKDYIVYLPLYDGMESLEIGIDADATIGAPVSNQLTRDKAARPVVFYGTSITQGGCASRPGMAYPAILGRLLNRETINLGFSGNGQLDFSIAQAIGEIDAEAVVIDCLPNCGDPVVNDSAYLFISHIAKTKPGMKIFMVEYPWRPVFGKVYERLKADGYEDIVYVRAAGFLGDDREATVDGLHFTDLGFYRYAHALYPFLKELDTTMPAGKGKTEVTKEQLDPMNRTLSSIPYVEFGSNKRGEAFHILVVGNSLSFHSKAENIGWLYENGMAASVSDKDYVHQLLKMTDSIMPNRQITVRIAGSAEFERNFATFDLAQYEHLSAWNPDLIIFQLGENVSFNETNTPALFEQKYKELVRYFKKNGNPLTICTTSFYSSRLKNEITQAVALSEGCFVADLSHLSLLDETNFAKNEEGYPGDKSAWKVDGIGLHPGDKGMKNIARRIFVIVNAVYKTVISK